MSGINKKKKRNFWTCLSNILNNKIKSIAALRILELSPELSDVFPNSILWSEGNISLPVRNSELSILLDDYPDIFVASLLILYCSFSCLILSSMLIISFYILSKRFFLKREELSNAGVVSITKNEYGFAVHFL